MNTDLQNFPHKRFNVLTGEWVLVSPHRFKRPWQGHEEETVKTNTSSYDETCYLCQGNTRASSLKNPDYSDVFIFDNDFQALKTDAPNFEFKEDLLVAQSEKGICRVVCFSPDHSKSLADMNKVDIAKVITAWKEQFEDLANKDFINYIQIFENKGAVMGCSNPHPHGQIWSQSTLPNEIVKKDHRQREYYNRLNRSLLSDYIQQELGKQERVVYTNADFVVMVPFWAIWPFETMIAPKSHQGTITEMNISQTTNFADAISKITKAYDRLFNCSFPYSSGIHQSPTNGEPNNHWHWHMSFYPPLLRSASVKKFMVGYEMFGSPQRDITAESAAERLNALII